MANPSMEKLRCMAPKSWISAPLGINILLGLCKDKGFTVEKYAWIKSSIINPEICSIKNKIFCSPSYKLGDVGAVESVKVDFKSDEAKNIIGQWINQDGDFGKITKYFTVTTTHALFNVIVLKGKWNSLSDNNSPIMKIYNSFNYTEDIKYEARILELPLHDNDFKLVVVVPNEIDTLEKLVSTLNNKGLEKAVKIIQPLFTATCELNAPKIEFVSEIQNNFSNRMAVQYGAINVNENGVYAKILTCLYNCNDDNLPPPNERANNASSFFFALTYKGIAIITGQYVPS